MILETLNAAFYSGLYYAVSFSSFLFFFFALLTLSGAALGINKIVLRALQKLIG